MVLGRPQIRFALATLAELHQQTEPARYTALPTGFDLLDDAIAGGIRQREVVPLGGKPGAGTTIAALQWARSMAQRGIVAVYLCFEHDEVTLVTRLLSCELIAADTAGGSVLRHDELQARISDVAAGSITLPRGARFGPAARPCRPPAGRLRRPPRARDGSGVQADVHAIRDVSGSTRASPLPSS